MWQKRPASIAIDSATYLLTISIDNVAMSLYDIMYKIDTACLDTLKWIQTSVGLHQSNVIKISITSEDVTIRKQIERRESHMVYNEKGIETA